MSGGRAPSDGRSGAARLLDVLAAFESRPGELSVKDIAAAAQLPMSTTYRIVNDLVDWGGLERVAEGRYRTAERLRRIAGHPSWEEQLRSVCRLFAHDFVLKWGHAVALSAWIRDRLVCVETIGGRHTTIKLARSGDELSVLATSAGKLLIATTPLPVDPFTGQLPPRTEVLWGANLTPAARRLVILVQGVFFRTRTQSAALRLARDRRGIITAAGQTVSGRETRDRHRSCRFGRSCHATGTH